jgi:cation transporter-like permease
MKSPLGLEARLPIFDLFKDAVFLLWAKRGRLVSMFLPIIVVLMVLDHYSSALGESVMATVGEVAGETKDMPEGMGRFLVLTLVSMLLSVLMATTVHRFSLQDSAFWPKNALRFPIRSDWRYLARSVQILAICMLILIGVSVVGGAFAGIIGGAAGPEAIQQTIILFMVPGFMIMLYVSARLSVTLPEISSVAHE